MTWASFYEPRSTPEPQSILTRTPTPEPQSTPAPTPEPESTLAPTPTPEPQPTLAPTPTPEPQPTLAPTPTPEPQPTLTPTPTPEPESTLTPTPTPEPESTPAPIPTSTPGPETIIDSRYSSSPATAIQGTWGHPYVAINCGQWCSPKFAVLVSKWMFEWIRQDTVPNHSQDATTTTLLSASKAVAAYIQASQALNRVIHTAVHQQTDSLREALNVLQSFTSVQPQLELQASADMEIPISGQSATLEDVTTNAVGTIDNRKGCLYRYLEHKKLKDGNVVSYPRVIGVRSPLNPEHWRWGFNWEEKIDGEWKCRSIGSVPIGAIPMIQSMQKLDVPLEEIIEFIRRAKAKK